MMIMKTNKLCTHAQLCANEQVIRATSPYTAPVCGPCHSHGAATPMGFRSNLRLWRRGWRWWWWWWNWNIHTYLQWSRRGKGGRRAAASDLKLFPNGSNHLTQACFYSHDKLNRTNVCTNLALWIQGSVRSCSGIVPVPHMSAAGKQTARSPVWLEYPAPATRPLSECQQSCCHGNTGKVRTHLADLSQEASQIFMCLFWGWRPSSKLWKTIVKLWDIQDEDARDQRQINRMSLPLVWKQKSRFALTSKLFEADYGP